MRTALITGATGGIGKEIAIGLATSNISHIVLTCRTQENGAELQRELASLAPGCTTSVEVVDLSDRDSISSLIHRLRSSMSSLDVLINNAAVVPQRKEAVHGGIEKQFMVNVLAYYMLMVGLGDLLRAAPQGRIVNVASNFAGGLVLDDLQFDRRSYNPTAAYQQSKQSDRMLTWAASEYFSTSRVIVNACHPGVVTSTLLRSLGMSSGYDSASDAAATPVYLALSPEVQQSGGYYVHRKQTPCPWQRDMDLCRKLWNACAGLSGVEAL